MLEVKTAYVPKEVEEKWSKHWFENQFFNLDIDPDKPNFSIALPPPNVTGNLHMGHALNGTLQDILIRWHRMQGYNVLWQAGTDHAGISTQMVVERKLKKEGKNRHQLGRDNFLKEVWQWREEYGNQIMYQYRKLGVSFNWDRVAFTMDEDYHKAINKVFVTLFKEGFIYRGNRVTNWCPSCLTSLSDLEVEHDESKGHLYLIKYVLADKGKDQPGLVVATTRPETIFGDVAVAVHPEDKRFKEFIGKTVLLPLSNKPVPVIADSYVDREFGTGALKITPAHDANDWEVGKRHNLEMPVIIDERGKLIDCAEVPAQYQKLERFEARKKIVQDLDEAGLLVEDKDYEHGVGHCERCQTVIEPRLSDQWYVSMKQLAEPAIKVVEEDRITFIPARYADTYLSWMNNIRDWCISRQLWWGHRIPVWTCTKCGNVDAHEGAPKSCDKCGSSELVQDEDVLDTWFSSSLWPFATLGWPEKTREIKYFYPTTVLSTAREIINLWVARMIFMSLKFTGTIPFKHVLIHPVVQTSDGKRMSKSKGNVIDPLDMINSYGADANRFWFASVGVKGDQDVRFREDRLDEYKRFANKLWNAGRFVLSQIGSGEQPHIKMEHLSLADRFILHEYNKMLTACHNGLRDYDFHEASQGLYNFAWDYFCDWYLEIAKIQLAANNENDQTKSVLHLVFEGLLRALHPIMPFITEELWSQVGKPDYLTFDSIMFAPYPRPAEHFNDCQAAQDMNYVIRVIRAIRNIRQTYNVAASAQAPCLIECKNAQEEKTLLLAQEYLKRLARVNPLSIAGKVDAPKQSAYEKVSESTIYVPLNELIDVEKAKAKLTIRHDALAKELAKVTEILSNQDFKKKAPADKVQAIEAQGRDLENQMQSVKAQMKVLELA